MPVGVLIAIRGARESAVAAAVDADRRLSVARRCADLAEALAAAVAGVGSVVLLSEQPQLDRGVVAQFTQAGVSVVGVPGSPDAAASLRSLGVLHILPAGADTAETVSCVLEAARTAPDPETMYSPPSPIMPGSAGVVLAVWGPTGAPGRTTLAVNLAMECAQVRPTLLVDADTYGGAVAQALGLLDESPGLAALARAALHGSLDDDTVTRHALSVTPHLRVLTGVTRADRWPELPAAALDPVWELLRSHAQVTVIDCGFGVEHDEALQYDTKAPRRNDATLSALAAADVVVAVGSSEPHGMQRLVHGLAALDQVSPATATERVIVVNRVRASVAGRRPREAVADALRRYSAVERVWTVPFDPKACDAATLAGQTLAERAPKSAVRKAIAQVAAAALAASGAPPVVSATPAPRPVMSVAAVSVRE